MNNRFAICALLASMAGANLAMAAEGSSLDAAKKYLDKGDNKAAVIELKNFLQDSPDNADARLLIGEAYMKLGDGPAAAKAFEKARDLKAPKEKWIVPLGRAYLLQGDLKSVFDQIKPDEDLPGQIRAQVYGLVGSAYLSKGDTAKAQENLDAALKLDPASTEALLGLAMLEAQQKNFKKTVEYTNQVIAKDSKHLSAWVIMGEAKRLDGDDQGAIEAFGKAIQIQPNDIRARLGRATSYIGTNKIEEAAKDVAEVRRVAGDVPLALYLEAVIDFQQKKLDEAQDLLAKATNAMPDHLPSKLLLGTIAYQKGQYETAENQLSQFLVRVPKHLPAAKLLAATRMKQNRPAEAVEALKGVEDQAKDDAQFLSLLGSAYLQTKQIDLGNEYLARAAAIDPKAAAIKAQLGLGQIASGNLDQAVADLKAAVELDQNLSQADVMLVLALMQEKKFDEAIEAANKLKGKMKDDPMPENLLGAAYMAKGDADKAREHWNAALKLKPDYATAALNLAKLELNQKNPEGAVKQFQRVLERDPKNLAALIGLAQVSESKKDYDSMEKYLIEAREKNPKAAEPALMLSRYYLAQKKPLRAMDIARDLEANNPDLPAALQNLALAQMANNQGASAVATFKKLVNKVPNNPEYRYQLGQALYKTGDKAAALTEWRAAVKESPDYLPAYLAQAELAQQEKKYDDALKIAEAIKARQPKSPAGLQLEGDILLAQKQFKKAVAAYEKAYRLEPNAPSARGLYLAQRGQGDDKAGIEALTQWLQGNGKDVDSWMLLGMGYQVLGKSKEALEAYEKAYALKPDNPVIQNNLAWMYQESGDKRALELADKLLPATENNPEIMDTVGWIYTQNGRVDKGLTLLQDAVVHAPQQVQIRIHVAEALIKAGRKDDARKELEFLLKEKKDFPERSQAETLMKGL
jgi:putative PEP-CTERM system TPR-repeat lipoprotein